jgi:HNH endonuclease
MLSHLTHATRLVPKYHLSGNVQCVKRRPKGLSLAEVVRWYTPTWLGQDECWPWQSSLKDQQSGYGQFWHKGRNLLAHRVMWEITNGRKLARGEWVRHTCDNPPCVNPAHLEVGSPLDNMHDMIDRGRALHPFILDEDAVREIRIKRAQGIRVVKLAEYYGVSISTIYKISQGIRRANIS